MLNKEEAVYYSEQLHPAFAGYVFDGEVTESDALAVVFHLIKKSVLEPEFVDNSILKGIKAVRKMNKKPQFEFEEKIIEEIFKEGNTVSVITLGKIIKNGTIQSLITAHSSTIAHFPIIENKLDFKLGKHGSVQFTVNGNTIDTVSEANSYKKLLNVIAPGLLIILGLALVLTYFNGNGAFASQFLLQGSIWFGVVVIVWLSFTYSQKRVSYQYKKIVLPVAQSKYKELYNFLKKFPPKPRSFTYDFIPHAIAFGIDTSWHTTFGLEPELKLHTTPIT